MRILVVGSGGVGAAFAPIAARRDFYEHIVFADYDEARATSIVDRYDGGTGRFSAAQVDASNAGQVAELCRATKATHVLNAVARVLPRGDARFDRPSQTRISADQDRRVIDALSAASMVHAQAAEPAPEADANPEFFTL